MKTPLRIFTVLTVMLAINLIALTGHTASKNRSDNEGLWENVESETIELTLAGKPGMKIQLEHSFGNINVLKGQNDKIIIRGEKRVSSKDTKLAREFLKNMELKIKEGGDRVVIETYYPNDKLGMLEKKKIKNFSISYSIEVPENILLTTENKFGNTDIDGISGEISITNGFGKINAHDIEGETELNNKFGDIITERIGGDTRINNDHGSLTVTTVKGELTVIASFGSVNISDVTGRANVNNSHGAVYIDTVHDNADITTQFGRVQAKNIDGNVTVNDQHASVEVENVSGNSSVSNKFGTVTVSRVAGSVEVTNQHSSITVKNILPSNVDSQRSIRLKTSFGTIRATMPEALSAKIKSSTSFGKLVSDFLITMSGEISSGSRTQNIEGVIGDGRDTIEFENSHGNIKLERGGEDSWKFMDFTMTGRTFVSQ